MYASIPGAAALRLPCIAVSRPAHGCREHVHPPPIIRIHRQATIILF